VGDRVLVTGANGFIGEALCRRFQKAGWLVRGAGRDQGRLMGSVQGMEWALLHDRSGQEETESALHRVQVIVHLAARVHVMSDQSSDPLHEFRQVNQAWTERLARDASRAGVRRFVYLSSIKVNGEQSLAPLTEHDQPCPQDPYGVSKWEAEQGLAKVSAETSMETVIVRPPLVYGPGVRGNFLQLLKAIHRGIPLPLGSIQNRRSLIYCGNLVDALVRCAHEPRAANRTYLISDGEDMSTPELITRLGTAMKAAVRLWPVPVSVLRGLGLITGQRGAVDRLAGSLQVDSSKIRQELAWHPPFSVDQGLEDTAAWFRGLRTTVSGADNK
jgi:nucleoside-diphosphate-sugar epimerase